MHRASCLTDQHSSAIDSMMWAIYICWFIIGMTTHETCSGHRHVSDCFRDVRRIIRSPFEICFIITHLIVLPRSLYKYCICTLFASVFCRFLLYLFFLTLISTASAILRSNLQEHNTAILLSLLRPMNSGSPRSGPQEIRTTFKDSIIIQMRPIVMFC